MMEWVQASGTDWYAYGEVLMGWMPDPFLVVRAAPQPAYRLAQEPLPPGLWQWLACIQRPDARGICCSRDEAFATAEVWFQRHYPNS